VIRAAREAAIHLVTEAERDECRFLELGLVLAFRTVVERSQSLGETRDFERAFAKVVRLLGIQQQNPMCHLGSGTTSATIDFAPSSRMAARR
jgi:hypothetical protein